MAANISTTSSGNLFMAAQPTRIEPEVNRICLISRAEKWISGNFTLPVSPFYERESQEKNFPGDWKEQRASPCSPAHVM